MHKHCSAPPPPHRPLAPSRLRWLLGVALAALLVTPAALHLHAQGALEPDDPGYGEQWALQLMDAPCAWERTLGTSDVTVAVIDTGVDLTHPDLAGRLRSDGFDFADDDDDPSDENGHGTHVAGIVAANINNAEGVVGLAPGVSILPIRVLDEQGGHIDPETTVAAGIRYATEKGARVINMSLGVTFLGDEDNISPAIASALEEAQAQGVLIVVAAGNDFVPLPNAFASNNPEVMVVAASNEDDLVADFSNTGPWIDVAAPGEHIFSTLPTYEVYMTSAAMPPGERFNQDYDYLSGTSMAAPHVAALAALLFSAYPDWTPDQVQDAIKTSSFAGIYAGEPDIVERLQLYGAGRIDPCAALADAPVAEAPAEPDAPADPAPTDDAPADPAPTDAPADPESVDPAVLLDVVQRFIAFLQIGAAEPVNALLDPTNPDLMIDVQTYLDLYSDLQYMTDADYTVVESSAEQAEVELSYIISGEEASLTFSLVQIDGEWYISDFDVPGA